MGLHPTVAEISLEALDHNLAEVTARVGPRPILGVVKADAYGHGAIPIARHLIERGVSRLGVAFLKEGMALREAGIDHPIVLLAGCFPEEVDAVLHHRLTPVVFDPAVLAALDREAAQRHLRYPIQIKIDTGMGRIGLREEAAVPFIQEAARSRSLWVEGLLSHFAEADLDDRSFAHEQIRVMNQIRGRLEQVGLKIPFYHMANSAAVLELPDAHMDLVRPGLMLYGYSPFGRRGSAGTGSSERLRPLLRLISRISALKRVPAGTPISYGRTFITSRESLIATLPIGYADGYPRNLSNRGRVLVRGKRVPVVGRVCMDMTMIDVTEVAEIRVGDRVTLIGKNGEEEVWADDWARWGETIPYEILCGIGPRIQRCYLPSSGET